jgi:signal transduction histidine kinase
MERVDLERTIDDCLYALHTAIEESEASILYDDLPTLDRANRSQMQQLFVNLLGNAIKYRRPDVAPRINIGVVRHEGMWEFCVQDNGQGIPAEYQDRVFGLFKRLHGRRVPGTGIGLSLCRRIVEAHGGRIWVNSQPGTGSEFHFTIPD